MFSVMAYSGLYYFGVISNYFKFVDSKKKNLKMASNPVGKMYLVSAYTCLYGNTNSQFFLPDSSFSARSTFRFLVWPCKKV